MTSPSYSTDSNGNSGIAFDFSPEFGRMATALETIATNLTVIASNSTDMKNSLNTLATLGSGPGIHMIGPWDYIGLYQSVRMLEQDHIPFQELLDKINSLPRAF